MLKNYPFRSEMAIWGMSKNRSGEINSFRAKDYDSQISYYSQDRCFPSAWRVQLGDLAEPVELGNSLPRAVFVYAVDEQLRHCGC